MFCPQEARTNEKGLSQKTAQTKRENNGSRPLKGRLSAYNLVVSQNNMQVDFTLYEAGRQLKLPMETEIFIAADDPVRLVSAVVDKDEHRKDRALLLPRREKRISAEDSAESLDVWVPAPDL